MKRFLFLTHLLLASIVAPALILIAVSGGLYLLGNKGSIETAEISLPAGTQLNFKAESLESDVRALLQNLEVDHHFGYIKNRGNLIELRPTSRTYLEFKQTPDGLVLTRKVPNLQKSMIELHKGHGPMLFKTYQKLVAFALLLVVVSGVWMGLASPAHRRKTLISLVSGTALVVLLVFVWFALVHIWAVNGRNDAPKISQPPTPIPLLIPAATQQAGEVLNTQPIELS